MSETKEKYTVDLNEENFDSVALGGDKLVIVDFWAEWCGPCRSLSPTLEELAKEHADNVVIGKLNVEEHSDIAKKYEIRGIPALVYFKRGEIVDRSVGAAPKSFYEDKINALSA